jgi:hypothetical protein
VKAFVCGKCADVQALQVEWRTCMCGNTSAHWVNPEAGTAEFRAKDRSKAFLLGLHNGMLIPALRGELARWEDFRTAHEAATDAPGYIFDRSHANCWAVVAGVGRTSDVTWAEDE